MSAPEQDLDAINAELLTALDGALDDFIEARESEGNALKSLIEQRLAGVSQEVSKVRAQMPDVPPVIRERIRTRLTRGKIECHLRFDADPGAQGELQLNEALAKQLVQAANWVKMQSDEGAINPLDILRFIPPHRTPL
ncbi:hypothetical protein CRX72_29350 [Pantoea sp. BRM17]|nr:hypothetical protein CRX72_29350 [Pantoea sp. BRM17]